MTCSYTPLHNFSFYTFNHILLLKYCLFGLSYFLVILFFYHAFYYSKCIIVYIYCYAPTGQIPYVKILGNKLFLCNNHFLCISYCRLWLWANRFWWRSLWWAGRRWNMRWWETWLITASPSATWRILTRWAFTQVLKLNTVWHADITVFRLSCTVLCSTFFPMLCSHLCFTVWFSCLLFVLYRPQNPTFPLWGRCFRVSGFSFCSSRARRLFSFTKFTAYPTRWQML